MELLLLLPLAIIPYILIKGYNAHWKRKERMERLYKNFEEFLKSSDNFEEAFSKDTLKNNENKSL